jgi:hypothetical protein
LDARVDQHDTQLRAAESLVAPGTRVSTDVFMCPDTMRTKLRYTSRKTMTSTLGVYQLQVYSANGLFDVDVTGVGGQPMGFDQWMSMYASYRVISSKIRIRAGSVGTSAAAGSFLLVLLPQTTSTGLSDISDAESSAWSQAKIFELGSPAINLSQTLSTAAVAGIAPSAVMSDFSLVGNTSANPADAHYWAIYLQSADAATTVIAHVIVEVDFVVDFFDRLVIVLSSSARIKLLRTTLKRLKQQLKAAEASLKDSTPG